MRIFHIATAADWRASRPSREYAVSTRGRTLAEEGFIHCSHREQVAQVFRQFYADAEEPLLLLGIDTDRLTASWQEDQVGEQSFPHVYGPINHGAVVDVQQLDRAGGTVSFTRLFLGEMFFRISCALGVMALAGLGSLLLADVWTHGDLVGALLGIVVGVALWFSVARWRSAATRR